MEHATQIVVSCPDCSDQRVGVGDITLRMCRDDGSWSYCFRCPACRLRAVGQTSASAATDAISAGAAFESWSWPLEMSERRDGPPLTLSDVLELHLVLLEPDWFESLRGDLELDH